VGRTESGATVSHGSILAEAVFGAIIQRMKQIVGLAALTLLLAASSGSNAQVVKQEPFEGQMVPGAVILVDDGSCGKGKIKQVTGGEIGAMDPRPRTRKCIPREKK
jgi:hypothetical protein